MKIIKELQQKREDISFPIKNSLDIVITNIIPKLSISHGKWASFNSIKHMNKAWNIKEIDSEMALFRLITAEEEIATAIMLSLKSKGYTNHKKLNHTNHEYKNLIIVLFELFVSKLASYEKQIPVIELYFNNENLPKLCMKFLIDGKWMIPDYPLNFSMKENGLWSFESEMLNVSKENFKKDLKKRANLRNLLLYASHNGLKTHKESIEKIFTDYQERIFIMLKLFLFIEQNPKQILVQEMIDSFIELNGYTKKEK